MGGAAGNEGELGGSTSGGAPGTGAFGGDSTSSGGASGASPRGGAGGTRAGGGGASGDESGGDAGNGGAGGTGGSDSGAGGCESAGCGGDVCPTELRCNGVCCPAPPANGTAFCENDACAARCNTNYHACVDAPRACFADDDVAHCGTTCVDCRQANASSRCANGACLNTCAGVTLACPSSTNGKPTCATWDFESGTSEGWFIGNHLGGTNRQLPSGFNGVFETRTTHVTSGSRSFAVGFEGDGDDYWLAEFRIRLCEGSEALDLNGLTLKFDVFAETANGAAPFSWNDSANYVIGVNSSRPPGYDQVYASCDWNMYPDAATHMSCNLYDFDLYGIRELSILMRTFGPWRGTFYFDDIRLEPTPPPEE